MKNIAVILAGGSGKRFGAEEPKQFALVGGLSVLEHSVKAFAEVEGIDELCVVSHPDWMERVEKMVSGFKVQGSRFKVNPEPLTKKREPESVPLSNAQIGVYVDCVNNPDSTIYTLPMKAALPLSFDTKQLVGVVKDIIKSHPALSVHFESDGVDTVQVTDPQQKVEIPFTEMSEDELSAYKYAFVKPFNLEQGPVYRVEIIKTEKQQ